MEDELKKKTYALLQEKTKVNREIQFLDNMQETIQKQLQNSAKSALINQSEEISQILKEINQKSIDLNNMSQNNYQLDLEFLLKEDVIYSKPLFQNNIQWRLKVYPNGNGQSKGVYLSVFLEMTQGCKKSQKYEYRVEMLNQNQNSKYKQKLQKKQSVVREFASEFETGECWGYNRFYKLEMLQEEGFYNPKDDQIVLKFFVRAPSYYQKSKDQALYIQNLEDQQLELNEQVKSQNTQIDTLLSENKRIQNQLKLYKELAQEKHKDNLKYQNKKFDNNQNSDISQKNFSDNKNSKEKNDQEHEDYFNDDEDYEFQQNLKKQEEQIQNLMQQYKKGTSQQSNEQLQQQKDHQKFELENNQNPISQLSEIEVDDFFNQEKEQESESKNLIVINNGNQEDIIDDEDINNAEIQKLKKNLMNSFDKEENQNSCENEKQNHISNNKNLYQNQLVDSFEKIAKKPDFLNTRDSQMIDFQDENQQEDLQNSENSKEFSTEKKQLRQDCEKQLQKNEENNQNKEELCQEQKFIMKKTYNFNSNSNDQFQQQNDENSDIQNLHKKNENQSFLINSKLQKKSHLSEGEKNNAQDNQTLREIQNQN
ncbi:TRAF-like protein [Pseudocohnilembus persalinus]|uniref:TRAF-like protein n=1 Tax=Pseudocohnilembus persalinus TaxID=266149 RepID=A0A0V0QVJ3_PSEPJ|nr:TRAF-like protein [Pseudocohnilembus persalinus]|eukprot:KRX06279.1 TRAF-like protein [Pseudocohnilembus persalinus]